MKYLTQAIQPSRIPSQKNRTLKTKVLFKHCVTEKFKRAKKLRERKCKRTIEIKTWLSTCKIMSLKAVWRNKHDSITFMHGRVCEYCTFCRPRNSEISLDQINAFSSSGRKIKREAENKCSCLRN